MTDVLLYQTNDDGDITVTNGVMEMCGGLETYVYICLFGGNDDDDGSQDSTNNWWGNIDEIDPARWYRSEFQNLSRSIPLTTGNLKRLEDAAKRDLTGVISEGIGSAVEVSASMPGLNRLRLDVTITAEGKETDFTYFMAWKVE